MSHDNSPLFQELKGYSHPATEALAKIPNLSEGLERFREQLKDVDVTIPIMGCQLEPPSFQSLLERGGVRMKRDPSFYFFIELMSQHNPSRVI